MKKFPFFGKSTQKTEVDIGALVNTYTVKMGYGFKDKLNSLETDLYEFFVTSDFKAGTSLSEKMLKSDFAKWNKDKKTVSRIPTEKECKKVCKKIAYELTIKKLALQSVPNVHINKEHCNYSVDFVPTSKLSVEFSNPKEFTPIESKAGKNPTDFIVDYINKHTEDIDFVTLKALVDSLTEETSAPKSKATKKAKATKKSKAEK